MEVAIISCIMELVYVLPHVLMVHTKILLIILAFYVVISVLLVPLLQRIAWLVDFLNMVLIFSRVEHHA